MFDQHGEFNLHPIRQVLVVELIGAFNELVAESIIAKMETSIDTFKGQPFGILILAQKFELGIPESDEIFKYSEIYCQSKGLTHSALVYKLNAQVFQIGSNIITHPEMTRFFTKTLNEALNFLNESGYDISTEEHGKCGY